jgi:hypothetical protein
MTPETFALCLVYWINVILWFGLLFIFGRKYLRAKLAERSVRATIMALTAACFARWFNDFYYAIMVNAQYGVFPKVFYAVMSQPQFWVVPKLVTLLGGLALLWVVWKILKRV